MLPPIKVKICDRNTNMQQAHGDKSAKVETQDGKFVIKKKENILPTDRVITYIPNDYVQPIKIKILDLDIVFAFLSGELARLAFYLKIFKWSVFVKNFGKFNAKFKFFSFIKETLAKSFGKPIGKFAWNIVVQATSIFRISAKATSEYFLTKIRATVRINEKYIDPQSTGFYIPPIIYSMVYIITKRTIGDITQGTIEEQFLDDKTIYDILYIRTQAYPPVLGEFILGQAMLGTSIQKTTVKE